MTNLTRTGVSLEAPAQVIARLSAPRIHSGETAEDYDALCAAHLAELAPRTPYEISLAHDLVRYEWDIMRMRRISDCLLLENFRDLASRVLLNGHTRYVVDGSSMSEEDFSLAHDLINEDPVIRQKAETDYYTQTGWRAEGTLALAFSKSQEARTLEMRIGDLERRRRILREDYSRLKAARASNAVEDAVVVSAADGH